MKWHPQGKQWQNAGAKVCGKLVTPGTTSVAWCEPRNVFSRGV